MGLLLDAIKRFFKIKGRDLPVDLYKQSKAPAVLVAVGFGKEYDNKLAISKSKSQRRNWKRWKRK